MKDKRLEEQLLHSLNAELSGLRTTSYQRDQFFENATGGYKVKRKLSLGLVLALALVLVTVTALAVGLLFSKRVTATEIADQAIEEKYGITHEMQTYFNRRVATDENGIMEVSYEGIEHLAFALGKYTVRIQGNRIVNVSWSHDGESMENGFDADAWGSDQITEMLRLNAETSTMEKIDPFVEAINARNGFEYDPASVDEEAEDEELENMKQEGENIRNNAKLKPEEMDDLATVAVIERYQLTEEEAKYLVLDQSEEEEDWLPYLFYEGTPCYRRWLFLSQNPNINEVPKTSDNKDGTYIVYVNTQTGVIEDIYYDNGAGGNG